MSIAPGVRLGPYEIVARIGAGGMGEVYRARDTRLNRTVAVKVLPAALAADALLRERFEREARTISSLQHPHICALYDVGREGEHEFLVLEYLEGETLADRVARAGALPVAHALKIGIEICDALDKAHRSGIVHRDLKPANVMLVRIGGTSAPPTAKLLDFGLAKAAAPAVAASGLSMLPTTPPNTVTAEGTILGTFQYMAPEQIEGLEADARSDIFAFGAVLFEMLTGTTAFEGKTRAALLGAILKDEPPRVSTRQPLSPQALDRIVAICLAKDADDRYQSARDLLRDLKWVADSPPAVAADPAAVQNAARRAVRRAWAAAFAVSMAITAAGFLAAKLRTRPPDSDPIQFTIAPPHDATFATPSGGGTGTAAQIAVSPDGRVLAFVAAVSGGYQLFVRSLGALDARAMPGTEDATFPFWSPDSRYLGFFTGGKLKKVSLAGGPAVALCDVVSGRGGTWNQDNVIVFSPSTTGVLQRVPAAGGTPQPASVLDTAYGETSHRFPSFLPDGRHFLFSGVTGTCCPPSTPGRIRIGTLDSLASTPLLQAESIGVFGSGHLMFNRTGTLMAQPFDAASLRFTGDAFPVAERVASEGSRYAGFSMSPTGVLVYARGATRPATQLTWLDRTGRALGTVGEPAGYLSVALSSDERRLAVAMVAGNPENRDIWIVDLARKTPTRFTFDPGDDNAPIWSPDDSRIVFQGNRAGASTLRQKALDVAGSEETLLDVGARGAATANDWSRDGRYLLITRSQATAGSSDIWALPLFGDRKPMPFVQTPATDTAAAFSPGGRWAAYSSAEDGTTQVYVQPFPPTSGKFQVSRNGGFQPRWRADGKELFFISPDGRMMAAAVESGDTFTAGLPAPLFSVNTLVTQGAAGRQYAVTNDGQRFLINAIQQQAAAIPLTVIVNWTSAVQR